MTDCNEEQKSEYIFPPTKYSTITPVRNKYIKHLEEYSCETENMNKVINTQREELYESDSEIKTIKIIPGNNQRKEEIKINPCSRIKQIRLNKIPLQQLELNPSVDSTPRDISVTSLASSISSIFLSPVTLERVCQTKLMKIKEKVINSNSEISQDFSTIKDFNDIKMQENSETPKWTSNFPERKGVNESKNKINKYNSMNEENIKNENNIIKEDGNELFKDHDNSIESSQYNQFTEKGNEVVNED